MNLRRDNRLFCGIAGAVVAVFATITVAPRAAVARAARVSRQTLSPEQIEARHHYNEGAAYFAAGRFADALASYQAGYAADPLPGFLVNMGHCHRRLGDLPRARGTYHRFVLIAPDSPLAPEVRALVRELDVLMANQDATSAAPVGAAAPIPPDVSAVSVEPVVRAAPLALPGVAAPPVAAEATVDLRVRPSDSNSEQSSVTPQPAASARSSSSRWWLWGGLTVAVVGGAVAAWAVATAPDSIIVHDGSLGTFRR